MSVGWGCLAGQEIEVSTSGGYNPGTIEADAKKRILRSYEGRQLAHP